MAEAAAAFVVKMLALKGAEAAVAAAVVNVAVNVAAYAAVSAITRQNGEQKQQGGLIDLQLNSAAPRQLVIGKRMTGGVLIDWYLAGTNNTKLYMPVYLSEGPCGQVTRVFADGREVWNTPLVHGVRTTIPDFRSGGDRLWLTYYDGRVGQTADATLVALGQGWTSANTMTGCAYVVVECQWDSDNMRSPPSLSFEMEGAKLYDRRLDTTAGGSGSHRIDNPATWAFSDNPMVALDHFLLGRYWDGTRTFGIGLSADEVPYSYFAAQANICDEDVDLKAGGTQKRYRANGFIAANEDYASTITKLCTAMAARPADFGGRFGVIGVESKTPVLTIDDGDLIAGVQEVYTPKRSWSELVGEVEGRFQDPAQLYQPTPYPNITDATWEAEDGGEPKLMTFDLEFETHVERAQRLATLKARAERRQATLSGVYPLWTVELERGDWFIRTGAKWGEDGKTFEVIERVLNTETYTVTIVSQEVDATDSAWDESVAADGPPTPLAATDELSAVTAPSLTVTSNPIVGAASNTPALKIAFTNPTDPRVHTMFVEVYRASDDLKVATVPVTIPDADEEVIIQNGIADGVLYDVRAKYLTPGLSSAWSTTVSATTGATYATGSATSVPWSGVTDSGGKPDDNADVTAANTAAAITGQGPWATFADAVANFLAPGANLLYNATGADGLNGWTNATGWFVNDGADIGRYIGRSGDGFDYIVSALFPVTAGAVVRLSLNAGGLNVSGGYASVTWYDSDNDYLSDTAFATIASGVGFPRYSATVTPPTDAAYGAVVVGGTLSSGFLLFYKAKAERGSTETPWNDASTLIKFEDIEDGANVTETRTAAAILSQGAFATLSSAAYGSGLLTGFGAIAALSQVYFGDGYIKETSGGATAALSAFKTVLGVAASITSQGAFATLNTVNSSGLIDAGVVIYSALASTAVRLGTNITRNDGSTSLTDALAVTSLGTAAAIASQGALATLGQVNLGASGLVYRDDGSTRVTDALAITSLGTAAAIAGQGALATKATIDSSGLVGAGVIVYTALASTAVRLGTNITRADGSTSLTDALAVTSLGTAAAIASQGAFATLSSVAYGSGYLTGFGTVAALSSITGLTAGAITGQGAWATLADSIDSIRRPGFNLIQNSSGFDGLNGWNNTNNWFASDGTDVGRFILNFTAGFQYIQSAEFPAAASTAHTFALNAGGATFTSGYFSVLWYTSAHAFIQEDSLSLIAAGVAYPRLSGTVTAPSTAAYGRLQVAATIGSGGFFLFYKSKGETGSAATAWEDFGSVRRLSTMETNANVTETRTAAAIASQGGLATLNFATIGTNLRLADGTTVATEAAIVTSLGTASAISGQGGLATLSFVTIATNLRLADGTTVATTAMVVTASGTAAAIAGQGALATLNTAGTAQIAANAVTNVSSAYTTGTAGSSSVGDGWTRWQSLAVTATGAPIVVNASVVSTIQGNDTDTVNRSFRIRRGTTTIYSAGSAQQAPGGQASQIGWSATIVDTPSAGSYTYYIETTTDVSPAVDTCDSRALIATELKR